MTPLRLILPMWLGIVSCARAFLPAQSYSASLLHDDGDIESKEAVGLQPDKGPPPVIPHHGRGITNPAR